MPKIRSVQFPHKNIFKYKNSESPTRKSGKLQAQARCREMLLTNPQNPEGIKEI